MQCTLRMLLELQLNEESAPRSFLCVQHISPENQRRTSSCGYAKECCRDFYLKHTLFAAKDLRGPHADLCFK
jgi:hypothetical protein